jgi:acyl-coenzyme A thioesterase PaaI-like protein
MVKKAFQDYYPEHWSHCYGCGSLNETGLQIKSFWEGDESVCVFQPRPEHIAIPGFVYGGLIASIIDCHGTGTASAALYQAENRPMGSEPAARFVTAALHIDYLKPTPLGVELTLRGQVAEIKGHKVIVNITLFANEIQTAQGQVVAVQVPEDAFLAE